MFYERTMHFTCQKKGPPLPPQLKLSVLVPPERHALLHLRCGRISTSIFRLLIMYIYIYVCFLPRNIYINICIIIVSVWNKFAENRSMPFGAYAGKIVPKKNVNDHVAEFKATTSCYVWNSVHMPHWIVEKPIASTTFAVHFWLWL